VYTIFINDKPFIMDYEYLHYYENSVEVINKLSKEFSENSTNKGLVLHTSNTIKGFESFCKGYEVIEAAGGIVENELKEVLLIHRKGFWDLPKGKIEPGETEDVAARREVREECGVVNLEIRQKLLVTYHAYVLQGKDILKVSHWYLMFCPGSETLKPQTEEDITEIKWQKIVLQDLKKAMMYKSIQLALGEYINKRQP